MSDPANRFSVLDDLDSADAAGAVEPAVAPQCPQAVAPAVPLPTPDEPVVVVVGGYATSFCYSNVFYTRCNDAWCLRLHARNSEERAVATEAISETIFKNRGACKTAMHAFTERGAPCERDPWKCRAHPQTRAQYTRWRAVFMFHQKEHTQCRAQLTVKGCAFGTRCNYRHIHDCGELAAAKAKAGAGGKPAAPLHT